MTITTITPQVQDIIDQARANHNVVMLTMLDNAGVDEFMLIVNTVGGEVLADYSISDLTGEALAVSGQQLSSRSWDLTFTPEQFETVTGFGNRNHDECGANDTVARKLAFGCLTHAGAWSALTHLGLA